jgi:hypothetical protein
MVNENMLDFFLNFKVITWHKNLPLIRDLFANKGFCLKVFNG